MLKDVTLGQYYSTDSFIHRLDPRVKIRFTLVFILLILIDRNIPLFGIMTAVFMCTLYLSRVPFRHMLRGVTPIIAVILICSAINIFTTPGDGVVHFIGLTVTESGIIKCAFIMWRMFLMVFMSSLVMYTTTPSSLTDGFEKCFHLSKNVAMGVTIALRFVSVLFDELDRIMKAQEARGAEFHRGGPIKRIMSLKTVIVPLFQNSIDRASNLAEAMDARCYIGGKGRTKLRPLRYDRNDYLCYIFLLAITVSAIWLAVKF